MTAFNHALAKAVSKGIFGYSPIKDVRKESWRPNSGRLVKRNGKMEAISKRYGDGEYSNPEDVYSILQANELEVFFLFYLGFV